MNQDLALWALSVSFGLWAAVLPLSVRMVIKRIDAAASDLRKIDEHLRAHINETEHRLSILETKVNGGQR